MSGGWAVLCIVDRDSVIGLCDGYLDWEERELTDDDNALVDRVMQSRGFQKTMTDVMWEAAADWIRQLISDEMHKTKQEMEASQ